MNDWDSGRSRSEVLTENQCGWEELHVPGSPTFVLPSGKQVFNPAAAQVRWGKNYDILELLSPDCPEGDCLQVYRDMLDDAIAAGAGTRR